MKMEGSTLATRKEMQQTVPEPMTAQSQPLPELTVRIYPNYRSGSKLLANASVNIAGAFAVQGFKIFQSENGPFVRVPSHSYVKNGTQKESDTFFPVTKEAREKLFGQILQSYEEVMAQEHHQGQEADREDYTEVLAEDLPFPEAPPAPEEEPAPVMSL